MKVFLMFVFCAHNATMCEVRPSNAIFPTVEECSFVAYNYLEVERDWEARKPTGVFCEIGKSAPKAYHVAAEDLP